VSCDWPVWHRVKPFRDRVNYDQDRIAHCCHRLVDTYAQLTSFCEYNAGLREADPWDSLPVIHEVTS